MFEGIDEFGVLLEKRVVIPYSYIYLSICLSSLIMITLFDLILDTLLIGHGRMR